MIKTRIPFVDLFCGAGGLSYGFEMAGFKSVFANDYDPDACATYALNHPASHVYQGDVIGVSADIIYERTGMRDIPLVIGGPNCQGVSLRGNRDPNDPKNLAFYNYVRLVKELNPEWFVMENVPGLMHRGNRSLATSIFKEFSDLGYACGGEVLLAADYGVPQLRYRLIIVGNRTGQPLALPNQTHASKIVPAPQLSFDDHHLPGWRTTRDAISDLSVLKNGEGAEYAEYKISSRKEREKADPQYIDYCRKGADGLFDHQCHKTTDRNIELIKHIPQGGNWKSIPEELRPERFSRVALKDHTTTYGRLSWDMPSRTITTYCNNISSGAFTHPTQHRGISVREGARLQSFPDKFRLQGSLARKYRQVGNAVPPMLAYHVAKTLYELMTNSDKEVAGYHTPAILFNSKTSVLEVNRPLQGMRFNLDKYLVTGKRHAISNSGRAAAVCI